METTNEKVTVEKLISATVKYSNIYDETRAYDISANVRIQDGTVMQFENGVVGAIGAGEPNQTPSIATFYSYANNSLNLSVPSSDNAEAQSVLDAIYVFMDDVRNVVTVSPITV